MLSHCLAKPAAWPDNPFDPLHPVVKVGQAPGAGRIFAFVNDSDIGVKAGFGREVADEWLDRYPAHASVMAYLGRSGWNTLRLDGVIPAEEVLEALDESYRLVVSRLPRKHRPRGWEQ